MAEPPFEAGAVKATVARALPGVAVPMIGAPGSVAGAMELEAAEAAPLPAVFVAVTLKLYGVPLVRPVTTMGLAVPVAVKPPGAEVTV